MSAFGLYVHWPYCAAICPYCDFNVYRARGGGGELIAAIAADIAGHARRLGRRTLSSVFLGGGTPSLLSGSEIGVLLEAAAAHFDLAEDCEISLEANPEDSARFAEHAAAGINRFSIGAQALDDDALKALGRRHDSAAALRAVERAAATGKRVSLDLIYARAGQGIAQWRGELHRALALPVEHVSLYQLTVEAGTAFARRRARGALSLPEAEEAACFYEATQEICEASGFAGYEISNHARNAAAQARHNLIYWRAQDWAGVGPGAHGRLILDGARLATEAALAPKAYIEAVARQGIGWGDSEKLTALEAGDEAAIMGLRLAEGVDIARIEAMRGAALNARALAWLVEEALLERVAMRLRLTPRGRLLANRITTELLS